MPHPYSPGEQLLAQRLADDPELAALIELKQRVSTVRDTNYLVDLLWRAGKLIIEVGGFRSHTRRAAFFYDRHRDYELLLICRNLKNATGRLGAGSAPESLGKTGDLHPADRQGLGLGQ